MASQTGLVRGLNARMLSYPSQFQAYPIQRQEISGFPLAQPQHADGVSPSIQMGAIRQEIARNLNFEVYPHYFPASLTANAHLHLEYFGPFTGDKQLWRQVPRGTGNGNFSIVGNTSDFIGNTPTVEKPAFIWVGMVPGPHSHNPAGTTTRLYNPHALRAVIKTPVKQGEWNLYGASNADVATGLCLLFKIENLLDVFWFRHPQIINKPPTGVVLPRNCIIMHHDGYCMIFVARVLPAVIPSRVRQLGSGVGNGNIAINTFVHEQPRGGCGIAGTNFTANATVKANVKQVGRATGKAVGKRNEVGHFPVLRSSLKVCTQPPRAGSMILRPRTGGIAKSNNTKHDTSKVQTTTTNNNNKSSIAKMKTRLSSLTAAEMAQVQKAQTDFLRRGGKKGVKKG